MATVSHVGRRWWNEVREGKLLVVATRTRLNRGDSIRVQARKSDDIMIHLLSCFSAMPGFFEVFVIRTVCVENVVAPSTRKTLPVIHGVTFIAEVPNFSSEMNQSPHGQVTPPRLEQLLPPLKAESLQ